MVQRALSLAPPVIFDELIKVVPRQNIRPILDSLKRSQFGKRIHSKLLKKYPELGRPGK